jgi:tetratricopeptide (TPR) repeat protein
MIAPFATAGPCDLAATPNQSGDDISRKVGRGGEPMKSIKMFVTLAAVLATLWCAGQAAAATADDIKAAREAYARKDYLAAEQSVTAAIDAGDLTREDRAAAHFLRGYTRALSRKLDAAVGDFTEAMKNTERGDNGWAAAMQARFMTYVDLQKLSDASADFVALAKDRPDVARSVRYRMISRLVWDLSTKDESAAFDVLKAMRDISYVPDAPGENTDYMTQIFVRLLVDRREDLVAMMELSKIKTADMLIEARVDRRYASLWTKEGFDALTDPKEIAGRELAYTADLAKKHPNLAIIMTRHVKALRTVGEDAKAVEVAREALANPELGSVHAERTVEDKLWLRNELVYALKDLGRTDETLAEMQPVLKLDEARNGFMISQLVNFGEIMIELGHAAEGVKTARRGWNAASPMGQLFINMVEVCGNATTDKPAADKALALLRKRQSENYAAMTAALLCMDRTDEVADLMKKRLSQPAHRGAVLTAVQSYKTPAFVTPLHRTVMERYAKVIARPDVQAAIKKHGRIEAYPFFSIYWGNL